MSGVTTWRSRPVFITSTFLDMQDERDFLRNVVFPELEEQLKARRQHLEWIDLRVGVANATAHTEEERELQVLKVCLAEVKRSRPFLIALIGDLYGTVLPQERINAATVEEDFTPEVTECSVTHLEIDFGVSPILNSAGAATFISVSRFRMRRWEKRQQIIQNDLTSTIMKPPASPASLRP